MKGPNINIEEFTAAMKKLGLHDVKLCEKEWKQILKEVIMARREFPRKSRSNEKA